MSSTPECDKMRAISHLSQACGEFVEWLEAKKGKVLCEWVKFWPVGTRWGDVT